MRKRAMLIFARIALSLLVLSGLVKPVSAEFTTSRLTADDAEPFDRFGLSVAISGNSAIVGGDQDDLVGGKEGGAVYLFDVVTGVSITKLAANDTSASDQFGSAVGISGNTAIVGANLEDERGHSAGAAYLFDITTGSQLHKLTANDASSFDRLAWSVAISNHVAIASTRSDGNSNTFSGAAYLFDVATGQQLQKLTADGVLPDSDDFFGWSVAVSDTTALVGAIGDDHAGPNSGAVYVFDVATGSQLAKLTANDSTSFDRFGTSVAISDNTAIVTARSASNGKDFTGAAYLFDLTTGDQIAKLTPSDGTSLEQFGWSIDVEGNIAIIGSILALDDDGTQTGVAYLFDLSTGKQLERLTVGRAARLGDNFGWSVGISGNMAIIGSPEASNETGSAFLIDLEGVIPEPTTLAWLAFASCAMCARRPKPFARRS